MTQLKTQNYNNLPHIGYQVSDEDRKNNFYKYESHIHKQGPLSGVKVGLHKLTNDVFTYFPKGLSGSKNSDFYEFLSLGMIPNAIGSLGLIALYNLANSKYNAQDGAEAKINGKCFGAGVALYALGKWITPKLAKTLIHNSTGVNLDQYYINKVNELPENGQEQGIVRTQYPKVFASRDFYRKDLIAKDSELNHGDMYYFDDKIAKKAGFKNKLNAPNQTMSEKIRELISRETAMENITKYITAATGVALGSRAAFSNIIFSKNLKTTFKSIGQALIDGTKELWKGTDRNLFTKHAGKALMVASVVGTVATWLIPTLGFKSTPNTMKSKIDRTKETEVC